MSKRKISMKKVIYNYPHSSFLAMEKDMEILTGLKTQTTIKLVDLIQDWWGWDRYNS